MSVSNLKSPELLQQKHSHLLYHIGQKAFVLSERRFYQSLFMLYFILMNE